MTVEEIRQKAKPIFKQHGVIRAAVFGSAARGESGPGSDVDVLVELSGQYGLFEFINIKNSLEDALGKKVDLVDYRAIKPRIRENILKSQVGIL